MNNYNIPFDTMEWQVFIPGVRHKKYTEGAKVLRLVEFSNEMEPHWCSKGHVGLILDGRFEIEFEDSKSVYDPGDGVFIPGGEEHKHKARVLTDVVTAIFVEEV
jgi:quercetin dioxygenase-like cupin family protein